MPFGQKPDTIWAMINRKTTKSVSVGGVSLGSKHPVIIQSMTKVATTDVSRCLKQVIGLAQAGCGLVRIAVPTQNDTAALAKIIEKSPVPIIADIHFSPARAIEAIEAGAAKIRLNPGNIKNQADIFKIIDCAKSHKIAIRIGVNEASIRDLKQAEVPASKRVNLMLREMKKYITLFEKRGFGNIVLSAKSTDTLRTIEINRAISANFDYPLHLGLTHAGLPEDAAIPSAVAVGTLLAEGIGDTVRISLAGDPVEEAVFAKKILASVGLYKTQSPELIVCPTCGRCQIDVVKLARQIKKAIAKIDKPIKIAVMGCVVNGPGEAADADIAICAAKGKGYLYRLGEKIATIDEADLVAAMLKEIDAITKSK